MHSDQLGVSTQIIDAESRLQKDDEMLQVFTQDKLSSQGNIELANDSSLIQDKLSKKQPF